MQKFKKWIPVAEDKCELEGPYECPECGFHIAMDATYLDQVNSKATCPGCLVTFEVPEIEAGLDAKLTAAWRANTLFVDVSNMARKAGPI
ncbi:MAG: hypothetical protein JEZ11_03765 [Desulfobacterales bacterium]|nr:hypothetical protein [Desulfobacterales bacterium]